jgi:hypothetical protein
MLQQLVKATLKIKLKILAASLLVALIIVSSFLAAKTFTHQSSPRKFYVGVEDAYSSQAIEVKALVDKVKNYTNLFIVGSVALTFNQTALDEACDYIFDAKLNFIVLFTSSIAYNWSMGYRTFDWMDEAQTKYGDQFLGVYRYDEPGGNQLDGGASQLVKNASSYTQAANEYVGNISNIVNFYLDYSPRIFTADYGLFWFDYKSSYSCVFSEFVGNESRQRIIALDRGAATAFNRDWGVIINWKYDAPPYLETANELYADLSLAYSTGAKYAFVFSYPNTTSYGTLTEDHFNALRDFWNTLQNDPGSLGSTKAKVAYVVPADYGFGFRSSTDTIWGLFAPDSRSTKIFNDVEYLSEKYDSQIDVLYDEPQQTARLLGKYKQVFYWNQTVT